ncbi:MAG: hypothetical protein C0494_16750 [Sphingobium sp.]|nr:hypothetical protein [Sphingobium sp.]
MKDLWVGLKDVPLWTLIAATIVAVALWQITPLHSAVPNQYRAYIPLAAFALAVFTIARIANTIALTISARRRRRREWADLCLTKLYRPMIALFNERHLTSSSVILAPYLKNRVANAWEKLRRRRGIVRKIHSAWRALSDRRISTSAEMEYGSSFPLDQIKALVRFSPDCADGTLTSLVRRADRSRFEDQPQNFEVTKDEYALAEHIFAEHKRLSALTDR